MKKSTCHPLVVSMETGESVGMSRKSRPRLVGFSGDGHGLSESLLSSPPTSTWGGCWDSRPACNKVRHLVDSKGLNFDPHICGTSTLSIKISL